MASGDAAQLSDLTTYISNIVASIIPLVGMVSFIMILVGGFTFLTSAGNEEGLKKGKSIIFAAITGLVLAIISWLALVIIETITGVQVTKFQLGI